MAQIRERLISNDLDGYVAAYRCFVNGDDEVGDALTKINCPGPGDDIGWRRGLDPGDV